jgi:hypothetical protein
MTDITSAIPVTDLSHVHHGTMLAKFDALVARGLVIYSPSKIVRLEDAGFHVSRPRPNTGRALN